MVVSEMECKKFSDVLSIGDGYAHAFKIMVLSVLKQELFFLFSGKTTRQSKPTLNFKLHPCMGPSNANILIREKSIYFVVNPLKKQLNWLKSLSINRNRNQ